jgi:sterol-4alpha-carboxylate 3-dehydrogenase (decarboxylating)
MAADTPTPPTPHPPLGNVLVVGGCGFLGHHIVAQLLLVPGTAVSVLDLRTTRNRLPGAAYHDGDITSADAVRAVLAAAQPDLIIHTASPAMVAQTDRALYHRVNVVGTETLLAAARQAPSVHGFVYTSSASVVHDTVSDLVNADESYPVLRAPRQREYYSETKAMAEQLVLAANERGRLLTTAIRPSAIFGEGDVQLAASLYRTYRRGQTAFQLGANDNLFDFTYVANVAHAHLLAAKALAITHRLLGPTPAADDGPAAAEKVDGEAFTVTNGTPVYFWDFARYAWKLAGDGREPQTGVVVIPRAVGLPLATLVEWAFWAASGFGLGAGGGRAPSLTRRVVTYSCMTRTYCVAKAERRLGYAPIVGLEDGLRRTMAWFLAEDARGGIERVGEKKTS